MPQVVGQLRPRPGEVCFQVRNLCDVLAATALRTNPRITITATLQRNPDGTWTRIATNCAALATKPQVTPLLVLEQVRKLVPRPGIGIAPPGGATLVNIQTLLWIATPVDQSLGAVTLLGHHVAMRVHVERVEWSFGDGQRDTTDNPGRAYDPADGCHTVTCPGY